MGAVPVGELVLDGRVMPASNATFVGSITTGDGEVRVVYKPIAGERPLCVEEAGRRRLVQRSERGLLVRSVELLAVGC